MGIVAAMVLILVVFFVFKSIRLNSKAKSVLQVVANDAVLICESEGIPNDFAWNTIESDYQGLLLECKGAVKAMKTAPDLSDRGISAETMEIMSLQELSKELAIGIQREYIQEKV